MDFIIDRRYNGPAGSAHGGVAAGFFAGAVAPTAATVRLHAPIPLGRPMRSVGAEPEVEIRCGDDLIATVRGLDNPLPVGPFGRLSSVEVERAEQRWLRFRWGQHVAPTCFACGNGRCDGLGLRPGPVEETSLRACRWSPQTDGEVPSWMVWAALDCPTGFPALAKVAPDEAAVTGQLAVEIREPIRGDGDYQILSRRIGGEGRFHVTEAAVVDELGVSVAVASATWVTVPATVLTGVGTLAKAA